MLHAFDLDPRLQESTFELLDWPLCKVLLKNNADYPWFILVPRKPHLTDISQCVKSDRYQLMDEINELSLVVDELFKPDKINIGSLGNIVSQLHIHVVARFRTDPLWPQGIWQQAAKDKFYEEPLGVIERIKARLMRDRI